MTVLAPPRYSSEKTGYMAASASFLLATIALAALIFAPEEGSNTVAVVFPPGTSFEKSFQTTVELGGNPISSSVSGKVVIANFDSVPSLTKLWEFGAIVAINPLVSAGCSQKNLKNYMIGRKI